MKKSVVILIALIYIASIALVGFFGLKFKVFEEIVYVSSVEILNEDIHDIDEYESTKDIEDYDCWVIIQPDENGNRKYQIEYRVFPDNATKKGVIFSYDEASAAEAGITVDEYGVVTFSGQGAIIIQLIPEDGSDTASKRLAIFSY